MNMHDEDLCRLFGAGTAPVRDQSFARRVDFQLQRSQQISALLNGVRFFGVTVLAVGLFVLTQIFQSAFGAAHVVSIPVSSIIAPLLVSLLGTAVTVLRTQAR
jgi:hypothetical protein